MRDLGKEVCLKMHRRERKRIFHKTKINFALVKKGNGVTSSAEYFKIIGILCKVMHAVLRHKNSLSCLLKFGGTIV